MTEGELIVGRYRIAERVGAGGMGVVWRAADERTGRLVALKMISLPDWATPEEQDHARTRLRTEAEIAAGLTHPHIVTVHELLDDGARLWIVMDYVPSRTLAQIAHADRPLGPRRLAHIGYQVADALAHAHARGVLHLDVTPRNILVGPEDQAWLTDFGLARPIDVRTVTDGGPAPGVPAYQPPELAAALRPGAKADVFALGASLYSVTEGMGPWGDNAAAIPTRALAGKVPPPRQAGPLAPVLIRTLRKRPADRPSAATAAGLLLDVAEGRRVGGPIPRWWLVAVATVAVVALAVAVAGALAPEAPPGGEPRGLTEVPQVGLGDPRTADPCALISPAAFERFGQTTLETDYGNFNRCDVPIDQGGSETVARVEFEPSSGAALADGVQETHGAITVARPVQDGESCMRQLRLPDGNDVLAVATGTSAQLCAIADVAADGALAVLARGVVARRTAAFPAGSLANVDACGLLDPATVATVPTLENSIPEPGFGGWECSWDGAGSDAAVEIRFDRNNEFPDNAGAAMTIGAARAASDPAADRTWCEITVQHREYVGPGGDEGFELMVVEVDQPAPVPDPCVAGIQVAAVAASTLQRPS